MDRTDRFKILVRYLVSNGLADNQKDLGRKLGYGNESAFSQIVTCKVVMPKDFISRLKSLAPYINEDWLLTGEGEMLNPVVQTANANGESSVAAVNIQNVTMESAALKEQVRLLKDIIAEKERLITVLMEGRNKQ